MLSSKNYCNIEALISNDPGVISPVGEITTYGLTFSRDVGVYQNSDKKNYTVYNFKCWDSAANSGSGGAAELPATTVDQAVNLVDFCLNVTTTTSGQIFADELLNQLIAYGNNHNISNLSIGEVKNYTNVGGYTSIWLPTQIKWKDSSLTDSDNEHIVWIDTSAFESEYSEYEIVVVPPFTPLDNFFTTGQNVANLIAAITVPDMMDAVQTAKGGFPESIVRTDTYNYINPLNTSQKVATNWTVLIYGPAGNNTDSIKDALVAYILANSTHTRAEWTAILPDIFKRTEFIIAPFWQNFAIPNMTMQNGVYSPIAEPETTLTFMAQIAPDYSSDQIKSYTSLIPVPYRSLIMAAVGGPENRDSLFKFATVFSDYIDVSPQSTDFNRMSTTTQNFCIKLAQMLIYAETMNEYTTLPQGYMRIVRNGILYVAITYNNIQYLVASKKSVYSVLGVASV
jgi:hypothetical protein